MWSGLADRAADFVPEENLYEVLRALDEGLAEERYVERNWVCEQRDLGEQAVVEALAQDPRSQHIEDAVEDFLWWAMATHLAYWPAEICDRELARNEPCGSGRKYKRCCMR